jgi:hypothetical protein
MNIKRVLESNLELYSTEFESGVSIQYRLLSIKEYKVFNKMLLGGLMPPFFVFEEIFELCYFGAVEYLPDSMLAGYALAIGELIYELSGVKEPDAVLFKIAEERKKNPPDTIFEHMRAVIMSAFSKYAPDDIDNMSESKFIKTFCIAENVLSKVNPQFLRLDLLKIYNEINGIVEEKEEKAIHKNDFAKEEESIGYWKIQEAEEMFLKEQSQLNEGKLNASELEFLDKMKR